MRKYDELIIIFFGVFNVSFGHALTFVRYVDEKGREYLSLLDSKNTNVLYDRFYGDMKGLFSDQVINVNEDIANKLYNRWEIYYIDKRNENPETLAKLRKRMLYVLSGSKEVI